MASAPSTVLTKENAKAFGEFAGLEIKRASQRAVQGVCGCIYGQGGSGKTLLVGECMCELGKTLYLDCEAGTDVLEHLGDNPNLDIVDISTYKQYLAVVDQLKRNHQPYENIVVDNLSELLDMGEVHFGITGNGSHDLMNYKLVTRDMLKRVKELRELTRQHGINVFFLCWDADEKDDRGVLKKDLALTPGLRKEYPGIINLIGHVRVTNDPNKRVLDFAPSPKSVAKMRRSPKHSSKGLPFQITYGVDKLPLVDVIKTIKEGADWPANKYKDSAPE